MARRTFDIVLDDGSTYSLRLCAQGALNYVRKHGAPGAAPWISICTAADDLEAQIDLFHEALHYPGCNPQNPSGARFIDLLTDAGYGDAYRRELVVKIANDGGFLDREDAERILEALRSNAAATVDSALAALKGERTAQQEAEEQTEDPT